jgi:hypothetical protein
MSPRMVHERTGTGRARDVPRTSKCQRAARGHRFLDVTRRKEPSVALLEPASSGEWPRVADQWPATRRDNQRARIAHELIESLDGDAGAERTVQVEAIRAALVEGEQSGIAEDSSLEGILAELRTSRAR